MYTTLTSSADAEVRRVQTTRTPIRVLLVDDHPAVRLGARRLIDQQPDMLVAAEAASVDEALSEFDAAIDVAVIDYHLHSDRDGLTLALHLSKLQDPPRVLIYSAFADSALTVGAIIAGADGLLGKETLGEELCTVIRRLARGQHYLPAVTASVAHAISSRLEMGDRAIFTMLVQAIPTDVIADSLRITREDLHSRRSLMLRALKPDNARWSVPGAYRPLDYERPRRRDSLSAA